MFTLIQNQINHSTLRSLLDITGSGKLDSIIETDKDTNVKVQESVLLEYVKENSMMFIAIRNNQGSAKCSCPENEQKSEEVCGVYQFYKGTVLPTGELQELNPYAQDVSLSSFITFLKLDALKWHQSKHPDLYRSPSRSHRNSTSRSRKRFHPSQIIHA